MSVIWQLMTIFWCFVGWNKVASDLCVGAKNNAYREFTYNGTSTFIIAMRLVHKRGKIGCYGLSRTNWGCFPVKHTMNIIVTGIHKRSLIFIVRSVLSFGYRTIQNACMQHTCMCHEASILRPMGYRSRKGRTAKQCRKQCKGRITWDTSWILPNLTVLDTKNHRIYPSPTLVNLHSGGWYDLPGYHENSLELVFTEPGFRYLYSGQTFRIWYGEDLHGYTEHDNHGSTCMDVYVFT